MNAPAPPRPANPTNPGLHPQTAMQLGNLLHKLSGNQKTRQRTLELIKEIDPGYRLPGDVQIEQLRNELKAEQEKNKRETRETAAKEKRANDRNKLIDEYGEEVVKEIEESVLKKYPHLDYHDAAKLHRADASPMTPTGSQPERFKHGQIWEFPNLPGLLQNADKAASDAAYAVIDELRAGRR